MIVHRCKMCGGNVIVSEGTSTGTCDCCGTRQTVSLFSDEKRNTLYSRGNHFRMNSEYDKAMAEYEKILEEDSTDAEAYWSLVLCRYGIEYVEDPLTRKRVPTVNRTQYTSIYMDENYKAAIENADSFQKSLYEDEAKVIDALQKKILAIAADEGDYDVFICYKENDSMGKRTHDSVIANDIYHQLKQEGIKVFFSRVTLDDKIGSEYEPYIFSAINSAKVMLVVGTKADYMSAPWVKNEWIRFLALCKDDKKKMLIPVYRDMDPYDMPKEFSTLQALDMGNIGFMQDLIRAIKKAVVVTKTMDESKTVHTLTKTPDRMTKIIETYIFLEEYAKAKTAAEEMNEEYPDDYRGWWGYILASTRNLTLDISENQKLQEDIGRCMRYIFKLVPGPKYEECCRKIEEYISHIAGVVLENEKNMLEQRQQEVNKRLKELKHEHTTQVERLKRTKYDLNETVAKYEATREAYKNKLVEATSAKDTRENISVTGKCVLILFIVLGIMASSADLAAIGCIIGGLLWFCSGIGMGGVEKRIIEANRNIQEADREISSNKLRASNEINRLQANIDILGKEITEKNNEAEIYSRYLAVDAASMKENIMADVLRSVGVERSCNADIKSIREQLHTRLKTA